MLVFIQELLMIILVKDISTYKLYRHFQSIILFLYRFHDDEMSFSINSDDPGIMRKTLVDDYVMAHKEIGLSYEAIKKSVCIHVTCTQ